MMAMIMSKPELRQAYRTAQFGFVVKTELPCQAADLLAWQWAKDPVADARAPTIRGPIA